MSTPETAVFLQRLCDLLDRIPDDLTVDELEWAMKDAELAFESKLAPKLAKVHRDKHASGRGPV